MENLKNDNRNGNQTMFYVFMCVVNGLGCSSMSDTLVMESSKYTTIGSRPAPARYAWTLLLPLGELAVIRKGANRLNCIKKML